MLICGVSSNLTGKAFDLCNSGQETKCGEMCVVRSNDLYELTETCGPIGNSYWLPKTKGLMSGIGEPMPSKSF